jgi:hypothetical protein
MVYSVVWPFCPTGVPSPQSGEVCFPEGGVMLHARSGEPASKRPRKAWRETQRRTGAGRAGAIDRPSTCWGGDMTQWIGLTPSRETDNHTATTFASPTSFKTLGNVDTSLRNRKFMPPPREQRVEESLLADESLLVIATDVWHPTTSGRSRRCWTRSTSYSVL